ncbi:MAG: thioredoxin family protein [Proteobacteria bacterium]|nr:thioredoxin family protein [Pseudomonadota bacterium]
MRLDIIKNVAASYNDILTVCMVSEEFLERFSQRYDVKGTPTFLFYRNGKERDRILGFTDRESLIAFLTRNLQSNYQTT